METIAFCNVVIRGTLEGNLMLFPRTSIEYQDSLVSILLPKNPLISPLESKVSMTRQLPLCLPCKYFSRRINHIDASYIVICDVYLGVSSVDREGFAKSWNVEFPNAR